MTTEHYRQHHKAECECYGCKLEKRIAQLEAELETANEKIDEAIAWHEAHETNYRKQLELRPGFKEIWVDGIEKHGQQIAMLREGLTR